MRGLLAEEIEFENVGDSAQVEWVCMGSAMQGTIIS